MPINLNDFKHRVTLRAYTEKIKDDGSIKRKKRTVAIVWASIQPLSLTGYNLSKHAPKVDDAQAMLQETYQMAMRETALRFDEVVWEEKVLQRTSAIFKDGQIQKCLIASVEEKGWETVDV